MDGLGLVYEGQGNTGSAAYNQPSLQYGQTPLDAVAQNIEKQNLIKQQQEFLLAKQKEKDRAAVLAKLGDINLSKFALGNKQEFAKNIINHKNQIAKDMSEGKDVSDPTSPAYIATQERLLALQNQKLELDKQGEIIDGAMKMLQDKPDEYDVEKSTAAIKAYTEAPNMTERMKIDPSTLLVRKPKKVDILSPLNALKGDYTNEYLNETPEKKAYGETLKRKALKEDIDAYVNNPANEEEVNANMQAGMFKDRQEYADYLYKRKENSIGLKSGFVKKAPKTTIVDIRNGNSEELMTNLGAGTQKMIVPVFDVNGKQLGDNAEIDLDNVVQLDNINSTINKASAINATNGQKVGTMGTLNLVSGAMALPLVQKGTNRILPTNRGSYTYTEGDKQITVYGDQKTIEKQLLERGIGEYKPMIFGKGVEKVGSQNTETDIWLPADAAAFGTNDKNKALTAAQSAYEIYKKRAEDLNKVGTTEPKVTAKTPSYTIKGQKYTLDQLTKMGYTESDVLPYLNK